MYAYIADHGWGQTLAVSDGSFLSRKVGLTGRLQKKM